MCAGLLGAAWVRAAAEPAGPPVTSVAIEGHKSLSTRDLKGILVPDPARPFDELHLEAAADSLLRRLSQLGYPFAKVEVGWQDTGEGIELAVRVEEGAQLVLGDITFAGGDGLDTGLLSRDLPSRAGAPALKRAVESDIELAISRYENGGYPFAAVRPFTAGFDEHGRLALTLKVDEGLRTTFGEVVVSGNTLTRDRVVTREIGIANGETYSAKKVASIRPRLLRLGIFDDVLEPMIVVGPANGIATVGIEVQEGRTNSIIGIVGYAQAADGDGGEFTGCVDLALGNIAGTGRRASALWSRPKLRHTDISFAYEEPYFMGGPVNVGVAGMQSVRDTLYTTTGGDLYVTAPVGEDLDVTWSIGRERYVPGSAGEHTTTSYRTALAASFDGTDSPLSPRQGLRIAGSFTYSAKELGGAAERERSGKTGLSCEAFLPVRAGQVISARGLVSWIVSTADDVAFHEQLTLGGASSLRGYREEQFRGTTIALGSLEYGFMLGRRSRAIAFVDVGHYYRGGSSSARGTKLGYGIGLRGESRLGIISLDYGLGEGDGILEGKLHVGLIREF